MSNFHVNQSYFRLGGKKTLLLVGVQLKQSTGSVLAQGPGVTLSITRKIEERHHRVGETIEVLQKRKRVWGDGLVSKVLTVQA